MEFMEDVFVREIEIRKVRHLEKLNIVITDISESTRKHLVITGRNGSGKTSVLRSIKDFIDSTFFRGAEPPALMDNYLSKKSLLKLSSDLNSFCYFSDTTNIFKLFTNHSFIFAFFGVQRTSQFKEPSGPAKLEIKDNYSTDEKANVDFMQHMANLRFNYLNAVVNQDNKTAQAIDEWIDRFKSCLCEIFEDSELKLNFDSENFKYIISSQGKKFDLNMLSDGFSAAINIVTELMMRMEKQRSRFYDMQGLVLIDEIETHLHIDLQKKILPFLTRFFPKIQFIVTTHSPFVLTSLKDAIIYDLESQEPIEDLSGYSVEAIIEGYFGADKYSDALKEKVNEYEQLAKKDDLSFSEEKRYQSLKKYFDDLSDVFAEELKLKIQEIRMLKPVE